MEKNFDRIIEEKLDRLKVEYDPESWQLLDQRLDTELAGTPEVNEAVLDEVLFEKLHRLRKPYNADHWRIMSARLEQEFALTRQVLRYKALELGLVALLLLTIVQSLPLESAPQKPWRADTENAQPFSKDRTNHSTAPATNPSAVDRPVADAGSTTRPETDTPAPPDQTSFPSSDWGAPDNQRTTLAANRRSQNPAREDLQISPLGNEVDLLAKLQLKRPALAIGSLTPEPNISLPINSFELELADFLTAALDPLQPSPLSYADRMESAILAYQPPKRNVYFRVGMFGGVDYNRVITPADEDLGLERLSRYTAGYGGGLTFGFEFGRWETETGLIYAAKQYQARPIVFFQGSFKDGYLGKGIKDIELNIVNIPLNFRYNFLRNEKWRMYMLAGASLQVAVQANYYTADQDGFRSSSFAPVPAPSSYGQGSFGNFKTLTDNLPGGWFEGGTLEENGYLTGNLGLGLERYFSGQWSIFIQPTYQHSINYFLRGLGPTKDEINTLSLYTGIRLRLKK